jgi:hypothetical protein
MARPGGISMGRGAKKVKLNLKVSFPIEQYSSRYQEEKLAGQALRVYLDPGWIPY